LPEILTIRPILPKILRPVGDGGDQHAKIIQHGNAPIENHQPVTKAF
jgi:hypothetical protein